MAVITGNGIAGDALDNVFYVQGIEWSRKRLKEFAVAEAFFFLPDNGKRWRMVRLTARPR